MAPPHHEGLGVAIGSWNLPKCVELQIKTIRHHCGQVPILIADDTDPVGQRDKWEALENLERCYADVTFWGNERNKGHYAGDASALSKSVQWGHVRGLKVVAKVSMRHFFDFPGWLQKGAAELLDSGLALASHDCYDNGHNLYIRSEVMFFDVPQWIATGAWRDFEAREAYRFASEAHYNHIIHTKFKGQFHQLSFMQTVRYARTSGIIWHCANPESDFRALASRHGMEMDSDFYGGGARDRRGFAAGYKPG